MGARMTEVLDLERIDERIFRGRTPPTASINTRVFGGQVAAQALIAAGRTAPADRPVHSLHSYFLRPGDPERPIVYEVDEIRDGGSFTTRRVVAVQNGEAIFNLSASFHANRPAALRHQVPVSAAPDPEDLPPVEVAYADLDEGTADWLVLMAERNPIELRFVDEPVRAKVARGVTGVEPAERVWLRSREALGDDPLVHACAATYSSDLLLLGAALPPHGLNFGDPGLFAVSLDHAVWFHEPFRADEWYLYSMQGTWADHGRALCQGRMYDRTGRLLASVMQEGLLSYRRS